MQMPLYEALVHLSKYGNGVYILPDGKEVMLYDVLNGDPGPDYDEPVVLMEWSANNVAVLTEMVDGFREESMGRIEF